ncbi:MAG: FHA domain-containing protein [Anaerolineae bacterium]|nr:FHA domain-containing protein [Anaerolineae bacterium]
MDMHWIESSLGRLESHLRELIEGKQGSVDSSPRFYKQLERMLLAAMRSGVQDAPARTDNYSGKKIAPDQYTLLLAPPQAELVLTHPAELNGLANHLKIAAAEAGYLSSSEPVIKVVAVPELDTPKALGEFSQDGRGKSSTTHVGSMLAEPVAHGQENMPKAFLIVNGLLTYALGSPVVNIGRDPVNQVCLDDKRVSRMHAQLRLIQGRFVIFDLDSSGGTFVNGVLVNRHALNAGDVILLAGVPLVYGQEQLSGTSLTQELPAAPPPPEVL